MQDGSVALHEMLLECSAPCSSPSCSSPGPFWPILLVPCKPLGILGFDAAEGG